MKIVKICVAFVLVSCLLLSCSSKSNTSDVTAVSRQESITDSTKDSTKESIIYDWSDYREGHENGYSEGYEQGYKWGYDDGYRYGKEDGFTEGYDEAKSEYGDYESLEMDAVDFVRKHSEWHPEEAIYIIEAYRNGGDYCGYVPTKEDYDDAIESLSKFYEYFYFGMYNSNDTTYEN